MDAVILPQPVVADPGRLLAALHQHRVTHITAVPTLLQALACQAAQPAGLSLRQQPALGDHAGSGYQSALPAGLSLRQQPAVGDPTGSGYQSTLPAGLSLRHQPAAGDPAGSGYQSALPVGLSLRQQPAAGDPAGSGYQSALRVWHKATPDAVPSMAQPAAGGVGAAAGHQPRPEVAPAAQLGDAATPGSLAAQPQGSEAGPAAQARAAVLPCMRLLASSGEPLAAGLLQAVQALLPAGSQVVNLYGSTEVAADCTCWAAGPPAGPPEASAALTVRRLQYAGPSTALTGTNGADEHMRADVDGADERAHAAAAGAAACLQTAAAAQLPRQAPTTVPKGEQQRPVNAAAVVAGTGCRPAGAVVPCGFPIRGLAVWVSPVADSSGGPVGGAGDQQLTPAPSVLPCGQEGEVWVAGAGVARGYYR